MKADGSQPRQLTRSGFLNEYPSWSPDGRRIVFQTARNGEFDVYVMGRNGGSQRNISRHPARDQWASWSSNGRYIAFMSERDGSDDVFLMRPDGTGVMNVTRTPDVQESHPTWSPTGELTYTRHADTGPIELGQPTRMGRTLAVSIRSRSRSSSSTGLAAGSPMMRLSTDVGRGRQPSAATVGERILQSLTPGMAAQLRGFRRHTLRSSANFVYSFQRDGDECFLRFAHDSERTRASVEPETKLLAWLTREGVHVPAPITSEDGQLVVTSTTGLGTFHAVVFGAEHGDQLEAAGCRRPGGCASGARPWVISTPLFRNAQPSMGQPGDPWTTTCLRSKSMRKRTSRFVLSSSVCARQLRSLPRDESFLELIAGDYQLDNLFWNGELRAIDFDDCGCR